MLWYFRHDEQMLYAFIDESYTKDKYYMGAFVIDEIHLQELAGAVARVNVYAEGFGIAPGSELHAQEIMSGKKAWTPLRGKHRSAIAIYRRALQELAALPTARVFIDGVDVDRLNARYSYPEPPQRVTLRYLLEAIDRYAVRFNERVVMIADEVPDQIDQGRRAADYQQAGTGGYRPSNLTALEMPITFGSSDQSPGLQAADLMVYLYRRLDAHTETDERVGRAVRDLWGETRPLRPMTRRWDP